MKHGKNIVQIVLVEDDEVDVIMFKDALHDLKIANPFHVVKNGLEALDLLRGVGETPSLPRPYVIVTDLDMPRMDGVEFIKSLRNDPELSDSIVFVLTTSKAEEDRVNAHQLNVAGYIVKSDIHRSFLDVVTMLSHYWRIVEFPA